MFLVSGYGRCRGGELLVRRFCFFFVGGVGRGFSSFFLFVCCSDLRVDS